RLRSAWRLEPAPREREGQIGLHPFPLSPFPGIPGDEVAMLQLHTRSARPRACPNPFGAMARPLRLQCSSTLRMELHSLETWLSASGSPASKGGHEFQIASRSR